MPVNITNEELDLFNKNGFSDDDVQATVTNYRNQGLDDNAIRAKIDSRLQSWQTSDNTQNTNIVQAQSNVEKPAIQPLQIEENVARTPDGAYIGRIEKTQSEIRKADEKISLKNFKDLWELSQNKQKQDQYTRQNAGKILQNLYEFENNHPVISGFFKDYMPMYRSYKQGLEFDRTHGNNANLSEKVENLAKQGGLSLIPATNLGSAYFTGRMGNLALAGGIDGLVQGLTSSVGDIFTDGADKSELIKRPLEYSLFGGASGAALNQIIKGAKYVKNLDRRIDLAKRKNIPLADRMTEEQLNMATTPASQYGVKEINSTQNEAIAKQIEENISAENELLREYKQLHSDMTKKYGTIENLKAQAVKEFDRTSQTGEVSETINDYRNLLAYEQELQNAKYVNTNIKSSSTREQPVSDNFRKNEIKALVDKRKDWGIAYRKASGNPKLAIETLRKEKKGFVPDAFYRDELGNIDLVWGEHNANTKEGYGLTHIIERRSEQGVDIDKFLEDLPNTISNGQITKDVNHPERVYIEDPTNKIAIALDWNGKDRKWIVTAFVQNKSAGKRLAAYAPQLSKPFDSSRSNFTTKLSADDNIITDKSSEFKSSKLNQSELGKQLNAQAEYAVLHNDDLIKQATEISSQEGAYSDLLLKSQSKGKLSALDFETGRQLVDNLVKKGKTADAINLIDGLATKASEAGQAVQALSLWSKTTPDGALLNAKKIINQYNQKTGKKLNLAEEQVNKIKELTDNIAQQESEREKLVATAELLKYQSELVPASFAQKLKTARNISLLLNPKTIIRNITGNGIFATAEKISQVLAAGIDKGLSTITGKSTRTLPNLNEYFGGMKQGFQEGVEDVQKGIDTRGGIGNRFDLPTRKSFNGGILGALETGLDYGLRVPDRSFYQAAFNESVINQMSAQGLKEATPEIIEQAQKEALEAVFQNDSLISEAVLKLRKGVNILGAKDFGLGDLAIPYAQTPANLVQQGINYSPLGFIKAGINAAKNKNQRELSLDLARAMTGTGIMGGGYALAKNGIAKGDIENRQERENLQAINERPFTINGISYNQLQPISIPLSAGVAMANNDDPMNAAVNTLIEMPFMDNANRFFKDQQNYGTGQAVLRQVAEYPMQYIPTLTGQLNTYLDPYERETYDPNFALAAIKRGLNKTPASRLLPKKTDVRGKEILKNQNAFDVFLNPVFVNKREDDPIMNEILRLQENTGINTFLPKASIKIQGTSKNGEKLDRKLTANEYSKYKKLLGEKTYSMLQNIINTQEYQDGDDIEKAEMIGAMKEDVKALVESEIFNKVTKYDNVRSPKNKDKISRNKKIKNFVKENY